MRDVRPCTSAKGDASVLAYAQNFPALNLRLGIAVGASMVASMATAATAGTLAPTAFKKLGVDPAIAAGPFVTTVCDVLGVAAYLLVAILVLSGG